MSTSVSVVAGDGADVCGEWGGIRAAFEALAGYPVSDDVKSAMFGALGAALAGRGVGGGQRCVCGAQRRGVGAEGSVQDVGSVAGATGGSAGVSLGGTVCTVDGVAACRTVASVGGVSAPFGDNTGDRGDGIGGACVDGAPIPVGCLVPSTGPVGSGGSNRPCGTGGSIGDVGVSLSGALPLRGPNGGISVGRGPNYRRNLESRLRRASARGPSGRGRELGVESRRSVSPASSGGFFSDCSDATRQELRESRAARLVAENNLAAAKAVAETTAMGGIGAVVKQLNSVVRAAAELEKNAPDGRVREWAKKVVEGAVGELSESASGALPPMPPPVPEPVEKVAASGSVSRGKAWDESLFSQLSLDGLDPEDPSHHKAINKRVAARRAAQRVLNSWRD